MRRSGYSNAVYISRPDEVAALIEKAAEDVKLSAN
jgi:hypothetical protein